MRIMTTKPQRKFNWIAYVVGVGLFFALWSPLGFVYAFLIALAGTTVVIIGQVLFRKSRHNAQTNNTSSKA